MTQYILVRILKVNFVLILHSTVSNEQTCQNLYGYMGYAKRDSAHLGTPKDKFLTSQLSTIFSADMFRLQIFYRVHRAALQTQMFYFSATDILRFGYKHFTEYTSQLCRHVSATDILQSTIVSSADLFQPRAFLQSVGWLRLVGSLKL